ncbi:hypothetical protein RFI_27917, partial [Reticulomyxa filosa]
MFPVTKRMRVLLVWPMIIGLVCRSTFGFVPNTFCDSVKNETKCDNQTDCLIEASDSECMSNRIYCPKSNSSECSIYCRGTQSCRSSKVYGGKSRVLTLYCYGEQSCEDMEVYTNETPSVMIEAANKFAFYNSQIIISHPLWTSVTIRPAPSQTSGRDVVTTKKNRYFSNSRISSSSSSSFVEDSHSVDQSHSVVNVNCSGIASTSFNSTEHCSQLFIDVANMRQFHFQCGHNQHCVDNVFWCPKPSNSFPSIITRSIPLFCVVKKKKGEGVEYNFKSVMCYTYIHVYVYINIKKKKKKKKS